MCGLLWIGDCFEVGTLKAMGSSMLLWRVVPTSQSFQVLVKLLCIISLEAFRAVKHENSTRTHNLHQRMRPNGDDLTKMLA